MPGAQRTAIGITGNETGWIPAPSTRWRGAGNHPGQQTLQTGQSRSQGRRHGHSLPAIRGHRRRPRGGHHRGALRHREPRAGFASAERVARAGARFFRGGAYKPRTSPYSFQGLAKKGCKILAEIREPFRSTIVTEAMETNRSHWSKNMPTYPDRRPQHAELRAAVNVPDARSRCC